jgi:hypothetical protein
MGFHATGEEREELEKPKEFEKSIQVEIKSREEYNI